MLTWKVQNKVLNGACDFCGFIFAGVARCKGYKYKIIMKRNTTASKKSILPFGIIISVLLVVIAMLIGIGLLIQGVLEKEFVLVFMGGFFLFGALAFVLGALTIKGCFDKCKIDVLGLYAGIFFVLFGSGFTAMTFQQNAGVWILIPILMVLGGVAQIVKCLKKK